MSLNDDTGGWSIEQELYDYVRKLVPPPATLLELGSGASTVKWKELGYKVISVEHDGEWLLKMVKMYGERLNGVEFIHAPIEFYGPDYPQLPSIFKRINDHKGWYNRKALREGLLHKRYDVIVVDGPTSDYGRSGIIANLDLFPRIDVPIFFDDMHRNADMYIAYRVAHKLGRDLLITNTGETPVAQKPNGDWKAEGKKPFSVVL